MFIHWDTLLKPLFARLEPKNIVEVGSENGDNTINILEYCRQHDAVLHAIDPVPNFDVEGWQKKYREKFIFYRSLSLNALPRIDKMDLVLIDGDHNWYTVYNELKLIEKLTAGKKREFPLVLLHDVSWPYARRDLYYDPETIPPAYLKPYRQKGMVKGSPDLVEKGGFNPELYNSIYENNFQNGVLTALEDFLEETELDLEMVTIPAYHGLAFLYPRRLKEQKSLKEYFDGIAASGHLIALMDQLEDKRIEQILTIKDLREQKRAVEQKHSEDVDHLKGKLLEMQQEAESSIKRYKANLKEVEGLLEVEIEKRRQDMQARRQEVDRLKDKLRKQDQAVSRQRKTIERQEQTLKRQERTIKEQNQSIDNLKGWIKQLKQDYTILVNSRRWRTGNFLINLFRTLTLRRTEMTGTEQMAKIFSKFQDWEKKRKSPAEKNLQFSYEDVKQLKELAKELKPCMEQLLQSRRWRLGSAIVGLKAILTGKDRTAPEAAQILKQLEELKSFQDRPGQESEDFSKLERHLEQLEQNYRSLVHTRRWKLGDRLVGLTNRLMLKSRDNPVTRRSDKLFKQFKEKRKNIKAQAKKGQKKNAALKKKQGASIDFDQPLTLKQAAGEPYQLRAPFK